MQAGRPGFRLEVTGLPAPIAARSIVESSMPGVQPCIVRGFAMYDYECRTVNPDAHQRAAFSVQSMVVSSGFAVC
jgi:hypothetical protein